jgi:hypothetical protein
VIDFKKVDSASFNLFFIRLNKQAKHGNYVPLAAESGFLRGIYFLKEYNLKQGRAI